MDMKVELDGKEYLWNGAQWLELATRLVVPKAIADKLSKLLERRIGSSNVPRTDTSSIFFFWDKYMEDMEKLEKTYQLNQSNSLMMSVKKGDHVWAFARSENTNYVLVMDLVVAHTRKNMRGDLGFQHGKYCAVGNEHKCRYFDVDLGLNAESIIKTLGFFRKDAKVKTAGQMFQGLNAVRPLTMTDESKIMELARKCPLRI